MCINKIQRNAYNTLHASDSVSHPFHLTLFDILKTSSNQEFTVITEH